MMEIYQNHDIMNKVILLINNLDDYNNFSAATRYKNENHYKKLILQKYLHNIRNHNKYYRKFGSLLPLSIENVINKCSKICDLDWPTISKDKYISDEFIRAFDNFIIFDNLTRFHVNILDKTILKYANRIDWESNTRFSIKYRKFSDLKILEYLIDFRYIWDWNIISNHPFLSRKFMVKYRNRLDFNLLLKKKSITAHFYDEISKLNQQDLEKKYSISSPICSSSPISGIVSSDYLSNFKNSKIISEDNEHNPFL